MKITKISFNFPKKAKPGSVFKGWAKVVFDDVLMVSGIRVFEKKDGDKIVRYILFPDKVLSPNQTNGEYISIPVVNTNDQEFREYVTSTIFQEYDVAPNNPENGMNGHN